MKKLASSIFLLLISLSVHAQFSLGVGGGVNNSTVSFKNLPENFFSPDIKDNSRWGGGFFVSVRPRYELNQRLSLSFEGQYSQEGYSYGVPIENHIGVNVLPAAVYDRNIQVETRLNYVRFNPQVELQLFKGLGIYTGVSMAWKVGAEMRVEKGDWAKNNASDIVGNTDTGLVFGLIGRVKKVYISAGFIQGLQNINNINFTNVLGETIEGIKQRNQSIQVGLGYVFGKKKM